MKRTYIISAIIFITTLSSTAIAESYFRDRSRDYQFNHELNPHLKVPPGVELKERSVLYDIPEADDSIESKAIMEVEAPMAIEVNGSPDDIESENYDAVEVAVVELTEEKKKELAAKEVEALKLKKEKKRRFKRKNKK